MCIRRTLESGWLAGLVTGLGAASADACYGLMAAGGLTLAAAFLVQQQAWLSLVGGLFLCFLGVKTLLTRPAEAAAQTTRPGAGLWGAYFSTFFLTLTNPMTILSFAAIFAGTMFIGSTSSPTLLVVGVFTGSASWWLALSFGVGLMRGRLTANHMVWINRISGTIIILFGIIALTA